MLETRFNIGHRPASRLDNLPRRPTSPFAPLLRRPSSHTPSNEQDSNISASAEWQPDAVLDRGGHRLGQAGDGASTVQSTVEGRTGKDHVSEHSWSKTGDAVVEKPFRGLDKPQSQTKHALASADEDLQDSYTKNKRKQSQADLISPPQEKEKVPKLTPASQEESILSGHSIPIPTEAIPGSKQDLNADVLPIAFGPASLVKRGRQGVDPGLGLRVDQDHGQAARTTSSEVSNDQDPEPTRNTQSQRPSFSTRALSTPGPTRRQQSPHRFPTSQKMQFTGNRDTSKGLHLDIAKSPRSPATEAPMPSPMPPSMPLPPLSIPTYLQLELSSHRPSQLYIHRSATSDFPYESSRVKMERLLNFLLLPPHLEGVLWFGTLACLDAWLYTFTILPLRLMKSFYILGQSWMVNLAAEAQYVSVFVYNGSGRVWRRRRTRGSSASVPTRVAAADMRPTVSSQSSYRAYSSRNHRRTKSVPSMLLPDDKADILQGFLIICTCLVLLRLDASRMYHWIRGQAAIKLYVIYNVLEVCDRLFSAIGQDVLECLFSREALERKPDGHSKVLRPFWLFILALLYTTIHSTALFYQVITLNVAVNSYSNALITLLISNQFVEIKSTVFKKFEKDNLFQLTCADVVERFQLWLMLTIIASRNIVETGGVSMGIGALSSSSTVSSLIGANASNIVNTAAPSIVPRSFTLIPSLLTSVTAFAPAIGHVMGPFLVVLGSEMLVDWLKHAYINKFNNTRPNIYGRFLDVLAKDYYSNAFADQNLTKRLGLPVIPLSCLFIRASVQTYHMFMAAWVPAPSPSSSTTLASIHEQFTASRASMPTSTVATLSYRFDDLIRQIPSAIATSSVFTNFTTILVLLLIFLALLACKLVLGMLLLAFARSRYRFMKEREKNSLHQVEGGKRIGGWGVVEVDEDKRRWIYEDDSAGLRALRDREEKSKVKQDRGAAEGFDKVKRYEMAAKRIW